MQNDRNDIIYIQAAIDALGERPMVWVGSDYELGARNQYDADVLALETVPSAQPEQQWIPCSETVDIPDYMVYMSFEEAKEILKKSIDETTNINEALEKTVQSIYLKGYENGSRRLWTSTTIPPKVSGKYLVTHGGNYILSLDTYTTMEDAVRIFDDGYENYIGWQSQNVIAYMPLPKPYKEDDHD